MKIFNLSNSSASGSIGRTRSHFNRLKFKIGLQSVEENGQAVLEFILMGFLLAVLWFGALKISIRSLNHTCAAAYSALSARHSLSRINTRPPKGFNSRSLTGTNYAANQITTPQGDRLGARIQVPKTPNSEASLFYFLSPGSLSSASLDSLSGLEFIPKANLWHKEN